MLQLAEKVRPETTALLVIDMQNDFCAEGGYIHKQTGADMSANEPIADQINALVEMARAAKVPVVWIKANYELKYLSDQAIEKWKEKGLEAICCEGGTWGWDFYRVEPQSDELVIEKHTYSAFFGTELDRILRFRGIKTIVPTGVATNVCVESTLRDGYFNGYYVVVPEECVGSYATDLHNATLANVRRIFGEVTSAETLKEIWKGS